MMHELELALPATATAPGAAREAVRNWLTGRQCDQDAVDTAALLVSELVTNAVQHATEDGPCVTVQEVAPDVIRVAVEDRSSDLPRRQNQAPNPNDTGGRGLFLIEALANAWGWEPRRAGKCVWFEFDCSTS